jgi:molybdopterin converting factor small subunit
MQKVQGSDFLYARGAGYCVRVQVPAALRSIIGKQELKAAVGGGDLASARKESHGVIAGFLAMIADARLNGAGRVAALNVSGPDKLSIDQAVYDHNKRMRANIRGGSVGRAGDEPGDARSSRRERLARLEHFLELQEDAAERGDFGFMGLDAAWLCEQQGWSLRQGDRLFGYLSEALLRTRLDAYRYEIKILRADFSEPVGGDHLFAGKRPKPKDRIGTLGALMDKFRSERSGSWSASTSKNYLIIDRVLEEVCGRETALTDIDRDFCRRVRDTLASLPSNYQKKPQTKGRSI